MAKTINICSVLSVVCACVLAYNLAVRKSVCVVILAIYLSRFRDEESCGKSRHISMNPAFSVPFPHFAYLHVVFWFSWDAEYIHLSTLNAMPETVALAASLIAGGTIFVVICIERK